MEMKNNVIPIGRGHEIREERESTIVTIEENFKLAVETYLQQGGTQREIKNWRFDVDRMITLLCRQPEEINQARMDLIADLLDQSKGGANFARDYNNDIRVNFYETSEQCLREALDFYWKENGGKLQLGISSPAL